MNSECHSELKRLFTHFNIECIVLRMTGKYPFVLGRLSIDLNHNPLLENNVANLLLIMLTLHYAKIMES